MHCFKTTYLLFIGLFALSCVPKEFTLEWALNQAGDNRTQLEQVLAHYQQNPADSLKYRAAVYLIQNMPEHYSVDAKLAHGFCDKADSIMALPLDSSYLKLSKADFNLARNHDWEEFKVPALEKLSKEMPFTDSSKREDIHVLTAEYLIKNIDDAFETWSTSPWAVNLNFDDFCEFILPYKVQDPFLPDNWREDCRKFSDSIIDLSDLPYCQYYRNSVHWGAQFVNRALLQNIRIIGPYKYDGNPMLRMSTWIKKHFVSCDEKGIVCMAVMRSKGIPVAVEYTPQWPSGYAGHSWCVVLVNNNNHYAKFEAFEGNLGESMRPGEIMAKVFRESYAINPVLYRLNQSGEEVPSIFRSCFLKDVTTSYMPTQSVDIQIQPELKQKNRFAFLTMFDNKDWVPIACAQIQDMTVRFENMGRGAAYLPSYYIGERSVPFTYPFTLDAKGRVDYMKPDTVNLQSAVLYRKYPAHYHVYNTTKRLIGGKFQAAHRRDFKDSVTIYEFKEWHNPAGELTSYDDTTKYRYWRFLSPPDHHNQMAAVVFYPTGDTVPNQGKIIGTSGTRIGEMQHKKEAMFDRDPFTFFDAPLPYNGWAGMDFGRPVSMQRILYVYRSDDNNIRLGDVYELFYWKDENGWVSLGKQQANNLELRYENLPTHALFFLRDHTRGKEERIFTLENGEQVWW